MLPTSTLPPPSGPIVLVDDEVELVQAVGAMLRAEFGEARVKATSVPQRALDWIKQEKPVVLITDVRMPQMSGLELIEKTQALWGPVPTIVITAFPSNEVAQATRASSLIYLPKPFSFQSLLTGIRQLETRRPASFRGAITVTTLADLLQLYAISGSTGVMVVKSGKNRGEIWFERGQVVHAASADLVGFEAFAAILSWPEGSFSWQTRRADKQSIDMSVSELLLEAYRLHDEAVNQGSADSGVEPTPALEGVPADRDPVAPPRADSWLPESFGPESVRGTSPTLVSASEGIAAPAMAPPGPTARASPPASLTSVTGPLTSTPEDEALERLTTIDGFVGAGLVDGGTEQVLGMRGGDSVDLAVTAMSNLAVMRSKRKVVGELALDDVIEDVIITLTRQFHLLRALPGRPEVFFFLVLDRQQANLALARLTLTDVARTPGLAGA